MQGKEEKPADQSGEKFDPVAQADVVRAELLGALTKFPVNSWVEVPGSGGGGPYQVLGFIAYYRSRSPGKLTIHAELRPARGRTANQTLFSVNVTALRACEAPPTQPSADFGPNPLREAYPAYWYAKAARELLRSIAATVAIPSHLLDDGAAAEKARDEVADHEKFINLDGRFAVVPEPKGFAVRDLWADETLRVETLSGALGVIAARRQLVGACLKDVAKQRDGDSWLLWRRAARPACQRGATCWKVQRDPADGRFQAFEVLPNAEAELRLFDTESLAVEWCAVRAATVTRGNRNTLELRIPF